MEILATIPRPRLDRSRQSAPQVFEALRELIVSVTFAPGMVLSRAELAEFYGLSQTPIRDALMRLGEEGLVDVFAQHATVVSRIDIGAALQAHFLRRSIELEILNQIGLADAPLRDPLLARLNRLIERQQQALADADHAAFAAADQDFHRETYLATEVAPLWDLVRQRSGHIDRLRSLNLPAAGKREAIVRDHRAIVDALARGNAVEAAQALRQHLSGTLSFIDEIRQRYPSYVVG